MAYAVEVEATDAAGTAETSTAAAVAVASAVVVKEMAGATEKLARQASV